MDSFQDMPIEQEREHEPKPSLSYRKKVTGKTNRFGTQDVIRQHTPLGRRHTQLKYDSDNYGDDLPYW